MKSIKTLAVAALAIGLIGTTASAQSQTKQMRIVLENEENGVKKSIDTLITIGEGEDHKEILKQLHEELGLNDIKFESIQGDGKKMNVTVDVDDNGTEKTIKISTPEGENVFVIPSDADEKAIIEKHTNSFKSDGAKSGSVNVNVDDNGTEKTIKISTPDGENVFVIPSDADEKAIIKKHTKNWTSKGKASALDVDVEDNGTEMTIKIKQDGAEKVIAVPSGSDVSEILKEHGFKGSGANVFVIDGEQAENGRASHRIEIKLIVDEPSTEELQQARLEDTNFKSELEDLKIYPNPSNGNFVVEFTGSKRKDTSVEVYDLNGRVVFSGEAAKAEGMQQLSLDLSDEDKGVYILQIRQGKAGANKKLLVQ